MCAVSCMSFIYYFLLKVSYSTVASGEKSEQVNALGRIKKVLEDAQPSCGGPDETLLCGNYCYQLIEKENQEVTWTAIPSKKLASLMFGSIPKIATESLEISSFWKVCSTTAPQHYFNGIIMIYYSTK